MAISHRQLLDSLSRMPFIDSAELAGILGEPHATVHRALTDLLADGIVGKVSHGTTHLPYSQRYYLTANGIRETAELLSFATPSDFVRAYAASREWLTLLIRRMDAVAAVYRLAASLSPCIDGLRSHVEFHRRGRFDATISLHDGRGFGVVRQGLALRRRSLYDRLRAIAGYDYTRRPDNRSSPCAQRLGGEADDEVLREPAPLRLLHRRGVQGRPRKTGPSPLVLHLVGDRKQVLHAGGRGLPRQPRLRASHSVAGAEAGVAAPPRADGAGCAHLRRQPFGEVDAGPHHRPPDDPP